MALLAATIACARGQPTARPNVVLVVIDCLRADHVSSYGYPRPTTPHLDRLAEEGIRFDNAYANATWTKPSIATLFSGRYPSAHGLLRIGSPWRAAFAADGLPEDIPMLAESLSAAGYRAIAAVDQPHLDPDFGFAKGFSDYRWSDRSRTALQLNRDLLAAWRRVGADRPVFAWVHYLDAHWPYQRGRRGASPELGDGHVSPEPPRTQGRAEIDRWVAEHLTPRNRQGLEVRYDREVAYVDEALGDLVARLSAAGLLERSLLVVTADHGEGFFEHGELMHGFEPYDEVARVPLIFHPPAALGLPPGVRRTLVSHVDFAPTLLDLLDLPALPGAQGASYAPVLRGAERADAFVLVQTELSSALRRGSLKLLRRSSGSVELFDLRHDPGERRNLAALGCLGECAALHAELLSRIRALGPPRLPRSGTLTDEKAAALGALGYL